MATCVAETDLPWAQPVNDPATSAPAHGVITPMTSEQE